MGPHSAKSIAVWAAMIAAPVASARPRAWQEAPQAQQPATQHPAPQDPAPAPQTPQDPVAQDPVAQDPVAADAVVQDPVAKDPAIREPAAAVPAEDVWELSLDQALGLALRDNLGLERSRSEADAARFDALSSWGVFD